MLVILLILLCCFHWRCVKYTLAASALVGLCYWQPLLLLPLLAVGLWRWHCES